MITKALQALAGTRPSIGIFPDLLSVEFSQNGKTAETKEMLRFNWTRYDSLTKLCFIVPVGFVCDGASVPRILWAYASPWSGPWNRPAVLHDYLLKMKRHPRELCDEIFLDALLSCGCSRTRSALMYLAVSLYSLLKRSVHLL